MSQERRPPQVPRNDQDEAVASYQARMTPLAKLMAKWSDRALDAMRRDLRDLMVRTSYDPLQSQVWANRPADSALLNRLTELAGMAPPSIQRSTMKSLMSKIMSGTLTHRKAVSELFRLECYAFTQSLRTDVAGILIGVAEEGMYRGQFMLQKQAGVGWSFDKLNGKQVTTFVGHRFTESSAYRFLRPVQEQATKAFDQSITLGESVGVADARLGKIKETNVWRSKREARTTITQVSNDAHVEEYKRAGAKKYEFRATFDERTCPVCGKLDHKQFYVDDQKVGVNYPPMHPNCRCTTVAALSKEIIARMRPGTFYDEATDTTHEIPYDFSYEDWYRTFGPGRTDGVKYVPKYKG